MADPADAPAIARIYAPIVEGTVISFETEVPTAETMAQRIAAILLTHAWLVDERDGEIAAYAYGSQHRARAAYRWAADVSVYVHPSFHRRGVGRRLYQALFEVLERQGYTSLCAGIALPNAASAGLHEALGFALVGIYRRVGYKLGRWHDVGWWQKPLAEPSDPPLEPVPPPVLEIRAD